MSPYPQPVDFAVGLPSSAGNIDLDRIPWYKDPKSLLLLAAILGGLALAYRAQRKE